MSLPASHGKKHREALMSIRISMRVKSQCLHVLVQGRFTLVAAQRTFADVLDMAVQQRIVQILLDGSQLAGEPTTIDRFCYAKFAALATALAKQRHGKFRPKFAYVLKTPVLDPGRFGETVAVNRGMYVKAFESLEAAREWLGLPATDAAAEPANRNDTTSTGLVDRP